MVASEVACAASHRKVCPAMVCMDELTPFRVWPTLSRTLEEVCERASVAKAAPHRKAA